MKYYKVTLQNGDQLYHESKNSLDPEELMEQMQEQSTLSPVEADEIESIEEITEDEYEDSVI